MKERSRGSFVPVFLAAVAGCGVVECYHPVAELVVVEVAMTAAIAFDVRVWPEVFQTAART